MWNIPVLLGTLCVAIMATITHALTNEEAGLFESQQIPVIRDQPNLFGRVGVGKNQDGTHTLQSNGIPDNGVGIFPNEDNPYAITEQAFSVEFPQNPALNELPQCLPANSIIGFAVNGAAIFSPFDEDGNDLNAVDFGGNCQGRTAEGGIYYFAQVPDKCSTFQRLDADQIFGVAIDGFPIYGPGEGDSKITNADLDACHGKMVNGQYRYYMTDEWPYVLGCFRGTPMSVSNGSEVIIPSSVCKFACNKDAKSNEVPCVDDFPITTPEPPTTTQAGTHIKYSLGLISTFLVVTFIIAI